MGPIADVRGSWTMAPGSPAWIWWRLACGREALSGGSWMTANQVAQKRKQAKSAKTHQVQIKKSYCVRKKGGDGRLGAAPGVFLGSATGQSHDSCSKGRRDGARRGRPRR